MLKIALVEDNPSDALLLRMALEKAGTPIEVKHWEDGGAALAYLTARPDEFDLLLLDLSLPGISGFDILEALKREERTRSLPIVIVSGSDAPADIVRSYRLGANAYHCKQVHVKAVFAMAEQLVGYWSHAAQLPRSQPVAPAR